MYTDPFLRNTCLYVLQQVILYFSYGEMQIDRVLYYILWIPFPILYIILHKCTTCFLYLLFFPSTIIFIWSAISFSSIIHTFLFLLFHSSSIRIIPLDFSTCVRSHIPLYLYLYQCTMYCYHIRSRDIPRIPNYCTLL